MRLKVSQLISATRGLWLTLGALATLIAIRLLSLGFYPLSDNTESRYAEIARRMVSSGDWVTPRIADDVVFWGKPPLSSWLSASSIHVFGLNEWAVRLPSVALALLVTLIVWRWSRQRSLHWAVLSISILWGAGVFFVAAGAVMTDMALAFAITMSMFGYWQMLNGQPDRRRRNGHLLFAGFGIGMLAKGPVAVVLIGMPIFIWAAWTNNLLRSIRFTPWLSGLVLAAAIFLPWYVLAEVRTPGFLEYFFVGEHWNRFTKPGWSGDLYGSAHVQPRGMIWVFLFAGMLPGLLVVGGAVLAFRHRRRNTTDALLLKNEIRYLWLFALAPVILFSMSRNVLWTYVLPAAPALALIAGYLLVRVGKPRLVNQLVVLNLAITASLFLVMLAGQRAYGGLNSAKGVIAAFQSTDHRQERLTFVGPLMYSSSFYSEGAVDSYKSLASAAAGLSQGATQDITCLRGAHLAVHQKVWKKVPASLRHKMLVDGAYGDYYLVTTDDQFALHSIHESDDRSESSRVSRQVEPHENRGHAQRPAFPQLTCDSDRGRS